MKKIMLFLVLVSLFISCDLHPDGYKSYFYSNLAVDEFTLFRNAWERASLKRYAFTYSIIERGNDKTTICITVENGKMNYNVEMKDGYSKFEWMFLGKSDENWNDISEIKKKGLWFTEIDNIYEFILNLHNTFKTKVESKEYYNADLKVDFKHTNVPYSFVYGYTQKTTNGFVGDGRTINIESIHCFE